MTKRRRPREARGGNQGERCGSAEQLRRVGLSTDEVAFLEAVTLCLDTGRVTELGPGEDEVSAGELASLDLHRALARLGDPDPQRAVWGLVVPDVGDARVMRVAGALHAVCRRNQPPLGTPPAGAARLFVRAATEEEDLRRLGGTGICALATFAVETLSLPDIEEVVRPFRMNLLDPSVDPELRPFCGEDGGLLVLDRVPGPRTPEGAWMAVLRQARVALRVLLERDGAGLPAGGAPAGAPAGAVRLLAGAGGAARWN